MLLETFIAAVAIMLVSLVGVVSAWKTLGVWVSRYLHYLISFSAGVFLIVAFGLVREVFENISLVNAITSIVFGALIFFVLGRLMPEAHHHHGPDERDHGHSKRSGHRIMLADALHNAADGIILVPAFAVSLELGIVVTIGIVIHEAVQEVSEFFVLRDAGYSTRQALLYNVLVSGTILIGVVLGMFLAQTEAIESALLGLAAGGFFYVVFIDLLPHSLKQCHDKYCTALHLVWAVVGVIVMLGVGMLTASAMHRSEYPTTALYTSSVQEMLL